MKIGFIGDPLIHFDPDKETTLFLMLEAQKRGHSIIFFTLADLYYEGDQLFAETSILKILGIGKRPFYKVLQSQKMALENLDVLFLRKDPPVDMSYIDHLHLLQALSGKVLLVNDPLGILEASEKIFPLNFKDLIPQSCVTRSPKKIQEFASRFSQGVVLKPLNSSGGRGVFYCPKGDSNLAVAFEQLSHEGQLYVIVQEYLPEVKKGDKRVMLLDGEILGYFARIPAKSGHRANLHSGGSLKPCSLSKREKDMALSLGMVLKEKGLYFVGLDLIGERLTEINVTSPMGLREINLTQAMKSKKSEVRVLDWVESQVCSN
ncbi:MAG: glutathione synthase [Deltaproteobacteria bacterium]|nr:glutathione synthase [Deltaproteobacteria bacterium]